MDKMWTNFITHFCQAHQELQDTDMKMDELGFQSANEIVEHIVEHLREDEENEPVILTPPPPPIPQEVLHKIPIQPQQQANVVIPKMYQTSLVQ